MANTSSSVNSLQTIKFVDNVTGYEYGQLTGNRARQFATHATLIHTLDATGTVTVPIGLSPEELRFLLYIIYNIPVAVVSNGNTQYYDYMEQFDEEIKRKTLGYFGIDLEYQNELLPVIRIHPVVEATKQRTLEAPTNDNRINRLARAVKTELLQSESGIGRNNKGAIEFLLKQEKAKLNQATENLARVKQELLTAPLHKKPTRQEENAIRARGSAIQGRINTFTRRLREIEQRPKRTSRDWYARRQLDMWNNNNNSEPIRNNEVDLLKANFLNARRNKLGIPATPGYSPYPLNWEWENAPLLEKVVRNHVRRNRTNKRPLTAYKGARNEAPPKLKAEIEKKVKYRAKTYALWETSIRANYAEETSNKVSANNRNRLKTKKLLMESAINLNRPNTEWGNIV